MENGLEAQVKKYQSVLHVRKLSKITFGTKRRGMKHYEVKNALRRISNSLGRKQWKNHNQLKR